MIGRLVLPLALVAASMSSMTRAADVGLDTNAFGVVRALVDFPSEQPVECGLWVVRDDWKSITQQWQLDAREWPRDKPGTLRGRWTIAGKPLSFESSVVGPRATYRVSPTHGAVDVQNLFWIAGAPADAFAGGRVEVAGQSIALPEKPPAAAQLAQVTANKLAFISRDGARRIEISFERPMPIQLQDARVFNASTFQALVRFHDGPFAAPVTFAASFASAPQPAAKAATITIDSRKKLNRFDGFGGNFVYGFDSPVTAFVLSQMSPAWARVGLDGREWEPTRPAPGAMGRVDPASRDEPGSPLRKRLELARQLAKLTNGRLIVTMWYPPEWMFDAPTDGPRDFAGTIAPERYEALAAHVTSYLLHLKKNYGVEPRYFSFNESDWGVYLKLDGEQTRAIVGKLGDAFAAANLKTTILLGDSADLAKGLEQIGPTLVDDGARKFVGALAYHPWQGQNDLWPKWAALAAKYELPLLATEMGSDADAWRTGAFNSPIQTLRLGRRYVEQLRDARALSLLEWEWTDDYPIAVAGADGRLKLSPRGEMLKQFVETTPANASAVATTSDDATLDAAALVGDGGAVALHLVNRAAARTVRVAGLPADVATLTLRAVDPKSGAIAPRPIAVANGAASFEVAGGAIATLSR